MPGSPIDILNENGDLFLQGSLAAPAASTGQVLTVQADKSIAAESGGSLPVPVTSGDGSPLGVLAATAIGELYVDTTNGALYQAEATDDTSWALIGGFGRTTDAGVLSSAAGATLQDGSGTVIIVGEGNAAMAAGATGNTIELVSNIGTTVEVTDNNTDSMLGFYGATPVVQPTLTAISTAAEIVAALQALGLSG